MRWWCQWSTPSSEGPENRLTVLQSESCVSSVSFLYGVFFPPFWNTLKTEGSIVIYGKMYIFFTLIDTWWWVWRSELRLRELAFLCPWGTQLTLIRMSTLVPERLNCGCLKRKLTFQKKKSLYTSKFEKFNSKFSIKIMHDHLLEEFQL